jgi:DNA-directed RNA polymerase subunit M/transcription elongation factor TFIIS
MDIPVVILSQKGDVKQGKLKVPKATKVPTAEHFAAVLKKKDIPSILGRYTWKGKTLTLMGYDEGKAGSENQIHLFPPLEGMTFYGDILVLCTNEPNNFATIQPFRDSDYETFYTNKMEGDDEEEEGVEVDGEREVAAELSEDDSVSEGESEAEAEYGDEGSDHVSILGDEEDAILEPVLPKTTRVRKIVQPPVEEPDVDPEEKRSATTTYRMTMFGALHKVFDDQLTEEQKDELEQIIYQMTIRIAEKEHIRASWGNSSFSDVYSAVARRIVGNLSPTSYIKNTNLWERFKSGEITLAQIANQNSYEMYPDVWQQMVDFQAKRERTQLEGDFSRATDKWQCNGCKMRKCTYYELQTRSADEPMTIFIQCLNCNKRWTQ